MRYFLYNKAADLEKGYRENCVWRGGGLMVEDPARPGTFISRVMDSRERETVWHRLTTDLAEEGDPSIQIFFYASEDDGIFMDGKKRRLQEYLYDPLIPVEEKQWRLAPYLAKVSYSPSDILLFDVKGRYLWVVIRLFAQGDRDPAVGRLQFFFPKRSWTEYLPDVYRRGQGEDAFLDRYLAIFQSMYEDLEEKIRQADRLLDTRVTTFPVLEWLAGWLAVEEVSLWPRERLGLFLKEAAGLYKIRGTREGLLKIVGLYTGYPAFLVEYMELKAAMSDREKSLSWERLYGTDRTCCFLLIAEEVVAGPGQKRAVESLLEYIRPAHITIRLVVLKPRVVLGGHCYLGVNSRLEHLRPLVLDGASQLAFTALKGNRQDTEERL